MSLTNWQKIFRKRHELNTARLRGFIKEALSGPHE